MLLSSSQTVDTEKGVSAILDMVQFRIWSLPALYLKKNCDCNEYFIDYQDYKIAVIESLQSIDLRYRSYTEPLRLTVEGQQQQVGEQFAKLKICQSMMSV